jgi:hypothetical protein
MAEAGLVDRLIEAVGLGSRDYAEFRGYGLDLARCADALAAEGRLPRARSQRILDDLAAASTNGTYFGSGIYFLARGRVNSPRTEAHCARSTPARSASARSCTSATRAKLAF